MAARNVFRVKPTGNKWIVEKGDMVLGSYLLKDDALSQASKLAEEKISSQVLIYRPDGSIFHPNH